MHRDTTNVEPEMLDYTSNNWNHWNSNNGFKEKFGCHTRKTFNRFITRDNYTRNITHKMECTALLNLKPKWWESLLVQEKYWVEKACDKRQLHHMFRTSPGPSSGWNETGILHTRQSAIQNNKYQVSHKYSCPS